MTVVRRSTFSSIGVGSRANILPGFKGQAICAFVSLKAGVQNSPGLVEELKGHVAKKIGPTIPQSVLYRADRVIK